MNARPVGISTLSNEYFPSGWSVVVWVITGLMSS